MNEKAPPLSGGVKSMWPRSGGDGAVHQKEMHPGGRTASEALSRRGVAGDFDFSMGAFGNEKTPREAGPVDGKERATLGGPRLLRCYCWLPASSTADRTGSAPGLALL